MAGIQTSGDIERRLSQESFAITIPLLFSREVDEG